MNKKNRSCYLYDSFTVYQFNDKYKVVFNNVKLKSGIEFQKKEKINTCDIEGFTDCDISRSEMPFDSGSNVRFLESLSRSKNKIFGYAMCNDWDYFCTFTLDQKKHDRFDINNFYKKFTVFINNFNRKLDTNIKYLLVPEQHKNGAWHMHGFIANLPSEYIKEFQMSDKLPTYIKSKLKDGCYVGSWVDYSKKFGFNDLEYIRDKNKASSYIIKYITKDMLNTDIYSCKHLYYCSKGLNSPKKIDVTPLPDRTITYGFENDFCKIKWYDDLESLSRDFIVDLSPQ